MTSLNAVMKTLENAPSDPDKLERLLKSKKKTKEEAMLIEDIQKHIKKLSSPSLPIIRPKTLLALESGLSFIDY
jgi:hypothetical protein